MKMKTEDAIRGRRSVRTFQPQEPPEELLLEVVSLSLEAPSWANVQPYRLALAAGELWKKLSREMFELAEREMVAPEISWPLSYPSPYKERRAATGYGLYGVLGIAREDAAGRQRQFVKNFLGFGAPAAVFVFVERRLGEYAVLDVGCWLATFLLAAQSRGLNTIAQAALAGYPRLVRAYFDVPDNLGLICGVSIGYADPADPVNSYRPERAPLDEIMLPAREEQAP